MSPPPAITATRITLFDEESDHIACQNHVHHIFNSKRLAKLLEHDELQDAVLEVKVGNGFKEVKANRAILAMASNYFYSVFTDPDRIHGPNAKSVKIFGVKPQFVQTVVDFIYSGKITIAENDYQDLYRVADLLSVQRVKQKCIEYLERTVTDTNWAQRLRFGRMQKSEVLMDAVLKHISKDYLAYLGSPQLVTLGYEEFIRMLSADSRTDVEEEEVFAAAITWLKSGPPARLEQISSLMVHIDLEGIDQKFLDKQVRSEPVLQTKKCVEIFSKFLSPQVREEVISKRLQHPRIQMEIDDHVEHFVSPGFSESSSPPEINGGTASVVDQELDSSCADSASDSASFQSPPLKRRLLDAVVSADSNSVVTLASKKYVMRKSTAKPPPKKSAETSLASSFNISNPVAAAGAIAGNFDTDSVMDVDNSSANDAIGEVSSRSEVNIPTVTKVVARKSTARAPPLKPSAVAAADSSSEAFSEPKTNEQLRHTSSANSDAGSRVSTSSLGIGKVVPAVPGPSRSLQLERRRILSGSSESEVSRDGSSASTINGTAYKSWNLSSTRQVLIYLRHDSVMSTAQVMMTDLCMKHPKLLGKFKILDLDPSLVWVPSTRRLYALGGVSADDNYRSTSRVSSISEASLWREDGKTQKWEQGPDMLQSRCKFAALVLEDYLHVFGGSEDILGNEAVNCAEKLRLDMPHKKKGKGLRWEEFDYLGKPRHSFGAGVLDGKFYVCGGYGSEDNDGSITILNTVECYDPEADEWSRVASMIKSRHGCCVAVLDGKLYVMGGGSVKSHTDPEQDIPDMKTVEVYDPIEDSWTQVSDMNRPRKYGSAVVLNGKIYVIGGDYSLGISANERPISSVEYYNPITDKWQIYLKELDSQGNFTSIAVIDRKVNQ